MNPDFVVWAGAGAFVLGYLIINQVMLRVVLLIGTFLYIVYYFIAADDPLWGAIYTSTLTLLANMIGLTMLLMRRAGWMLPARFRDLRDRFSNVPPGDLRSVLKHAERWVTDRPMTLTTEGARVDTLYFVIKGRLEAEKLGETFRIPPGVFVGEVAYLMNSKGSATVRLEAGAEIIAWPLDKLKAQARRNPRAELALNSIISTDLAAKVALAVAPKVLPAGLIGEDEPGHRMAATP